MKVLVCGSRDWGLTVTDRRAVLNALRQLPSGTEIIHGGASRHVDGGPEESADALASIAATLVGLRQSEFRPDWQKHGKRAGILRNLAMLDEQPDLVIAFQRNGSKGTQHTIDEARRRGIPVEVHTP